MVCVLSGVEIWHITHVIHHQFDSSVHLITHFKLDFDIYDIR